MMKKNLFVPLVVLALAFLFLLTPVYGAPASGKPIKIGIIGPMDMRTGNHMFITAQMAVEKINAAGGVKVGTTRRPIELVKITSNEFKKVSDAIAAAERAITADKVDILIGGVVAEAVAAIQDIAADNKTIYINAAYFISQPYVDRMTKDYNRYKYCFSTAADEASNIAKVHIGIVDVVNTAIKKSGVSKVRIAQMVEKTAGGDSIVQLTSIGISQNGHGNIR